MQRMLEMLMMQDIQRRRIARDAGHAEDVRHEHQLSSRNPSRNPSVFPLTSSTKEKGVHHFETPLPHLRRLRGWLLFRKHLRCAVPSPFRKGLFTGGVFSCSKHDAIWVWLKIEELGLRRFWSLCPSKGPKSGTSSCRSDADSSSSQRRTRNRG